jgi:TolB-like protein/DNA-binding winged helix-turn-helix (wHTH) protein
MPVSADNSAAVPGSDIGRRATVRFGDFELSLKSGELRRSGRPVKLQQQPCKVLAVLATRAGELVTRDELRQEIWPNGTFVDFEHGINFCIKQVRSALGDDAQSPIYIETLPRRGYRFIAAVEILNGNSTESLGQRAADDPGEQGLQAPPETSSSIPESTPPEKSIVRRLWARTRPPWSRTDYVVGLLLAVALLAPVAYLLSGLFIRGNSAPPGRIMLAIMPFDYVGADTDQRFLADGLTEEMIMQLGSLEPRRLSVIARTSVMRYKRNGRDTQQTSPDIRQIGKDLGVDYVLEGTVRTDAERVAITARLIHAGDQTQLWSASFEPTRAGVLAVQKSIAVEIARSLAIKLLPPATGSPKARETGDAQAHELYLRAQYLKNKGDAADLQRSADYFQQAVEQDSEYALAYSGLADSYRLLALTGAMPPSGAFPKSRGAASRALELDDKLPEAHSAMGSARLWFDRDLPEAEREFQRAFELNPSYGWAHHDYAWLLVAAGRFDEALGQIKQAQALDPLSPLVNSDVGWVYLFSRRYDEAIDQIRRTLDLEPGFGSARACLIQAYIYKGTIPDALALGKEEMTRAGATPQALASIANPDTSAGLRSYLVWMLEREERLSGDTQPSPFRIARLYAEIGDKDRALASLAEAVRYHDPMLLFVKVDPAYDSLQSDARFVVLVQRLL